MLIMDIILYSCDIFSNSIIEILLSIKYKKLLTSDNIKYNQSELFLLYYKVFLYDEVILKIFTFNNIFHNDF